jgi:hypothetical protein
MTVLKPGTRWKSTTCTTEVVVVKSSPGEHTLECGGRPMVPHDSDAAVDGSPAAGADEGTLIGKRYVDEGETVELLCSKAGEGSLAVDGAPLAQKGAKALPSSD